MKRSRGMTLIEVMVSLAILAMISLLIYGAFDSLSMGKKGEAMKTDRARQGRGAILRMTRELSAAFLSMHAPQNPSLITRTTAMVGVNSTPFDRVDFTSFAHRRVDRDAKESDQAEVGYFASKDPDADKYDLVRREQTPIDFDPKKGGVVNVLAENIESFDIRFLDPRTAQWLEYWDTTQVSGQLNRLPLEIKITLVLANCPLGVEKTFTTKFMLPMQDPLSFGIPR